METLIRGTAPNSTICRTNHSSSTTPVFTMHARTAGKFVISRNGPGRIAKTTWVMREWVMGVWVMSVSDERLRW